MFEVCEIETITKFDFTFIYFVSFGVEIVCAGASDDHESTCVVKDILYPEETKQHVKSIVNISLAPSQISTLRNQCVRFDFIQGSYTSHTNNPKNKECNLENKMDVWNE